MIHKFARFQVKRDKLAEAVACVATFVDEVARKEGGTAKYEAFQDAADPTQFTHYMVFRTPSAEKYHQTTPWVKTFVAKLYPLCVEEPAFVDVTPVGKP
jgi:quinol monooxygenase YgiN